MGEENSSILHLPVRVTVDTSQEVNLDLINRHTLEPVTLDEIFAFSGNCSNDGLDSYFTRMDPITTLRNYAEDLKNGVSLQEGHNIRINPYGRSYDGALIPAGDDNNTFNSVRGNWYIMRGLTINGSNTDDTIKAIKAGIIRDMSVGFTDESYRCGSCDRDLWDWECPHIPGLEDEQGRISFAWIMDARLREVSTVYKGATPGAYIDKARDYVTQGELPVEKIQRLEQRYQVRLDDGKRSFYSPKREDKQNMNILEQIRQAVKENKIEKARVYEVLQGDGDPFRQPDDIALRNELGDSATVEGIRLMKTEAEQGRQYVADMIDQAVNARVKAQGEGVNADSYRQMLVRTADINYIKDEIQSFNELSDQRFTAGRQTEKEKLETPESNGRQEATNFQEENIFE